MNFINKYNIINECQYGFRNNISTADAISETVEIISDKLESLQKCAIISIDLRKAFDTLDHTILLNKLFIEYIYLYIYTYMELEVQLLI